MNDRTRLTAVVLSLAGLLVAAAFAMAPQADNADMAKAITQLDHDWLSAASHRDTAALGRIFSSRFTEVHSGGGVVDKQEQIAEIRAATTKLNVEPTEIVVRYLSPDVAVLTDKTVIHGTRKGEDITGTYRVLRAFVRENGTWHAAGAGLTLITELPKNSR